MKWHNVGVGVSVAVLAGLSFCLGRVSLVPHVSAAPPPDKAAAAAAAQRPADYSQRVVAYIYGTIPITREDLGEYLISRQGADKLEYLINKRIIEHECKEKGIAITAAEVDESLAADLKELKLTQKDFENRLLKEYRKTLYEWKEDVIWPKLALTRLCRGRVKVEPKDLDAAFEAYHGEKVDGRMIVFTKDEREVAMKIWPKVRDSEEEFTRYAKQQASPTLRPTGGKLQQPIGRHTTGSEEVEKEIFGLLPGEVSTIMSTNDALIIFKCDKKIPADKNVTLESIRAKLEKEIIDKKVQAEMPKFFKDLREAATPKNFLSRVLTAEDQDRQVQEEFNADVPHGPPVKKPTPPGN